MPKNSKNPRNDKTHNEMAYVTRPYNNRFLEYLQTVSYVINSTTNYNRK